MSAVHQSTTQSSRPVPVGSAAAALRYVTNDQLRVGKIEDRLKQWHAQLGENSKTQIRPLTRYVSIDYSIDRDECCCCSFRMSQLHQSMEVFI